MCCTVNQEGWGSQNGPEHPSTSEVTAVSKLSETVLIYYNPYIHYVNSYNSILVLNC